MAVAALALGGASLLGSILGALGGKNKTLDPEVLKRLFGAEAINEETMKLFNTIIGSPYGQNLLREASLRGGQISQGISQRLAAAGLAGGGAETGVGSFAATAGQSAGDLLTSQARSGVFGQAMDAASQIVRDRMAAYTNSQLQQQGQPSTLQQIGGALSGAAGIGLAALPTKSAAAPAPTGAPAGGRASYVPDFEGSRLGYQRRAPLYGSQGPSLGSRLNSALTRF